MDRCQPHGFRMHLLGRDFHTFIRGASFPSQTDVGSHNPPPLGDPVFSLAHRPVSGSDTICKSPSPPLTDIVCFDPLRITISLTASQF